MSLTQTALNSEASVGPAEFFCHICGGSKTDRISSSKEVGDQMELLRRFHRRRLKHPTETALKDRATFTHDYLSDVVACRNCGLLCRLPRPSARAITQAYSEDRYGAAHLNSEFHLQHQWAQAKVRALESRMPSQSSRRPVVIEVGSFVGGFLFAGQQRGWKMMGVDPGEEVTNFCRNRGLDVSRGTLMEASIKPQSVDAVAIWNTFDQLPNPDSTLAAARRILGSHGTLVVRIPNGSFFRQLTLWHKRFSEPVRGWVTAALAWNNMLGFPYLYGYTLSAMDQVVARHGFARLAVCPDTLMTLANQDVRTWARWEEAIVKWSCLAAANVDRARDEAGYRFAPWLDIYYRVVPTVPDTGLTVARDSHAGSTYVAARNEPHSEPTETCAEGRGGASMVSPSPSARAVRNRLLPEQGLVLLLLAGCLTLLSGTAADPAPIPKPGPGPTDPVPRPPVPIPEPPQPGPSPLPGPGSPLPSPGPPPS